VQETRPLQPAGPPPGWYREYWWGLLLLALAAIALVIVIIWLVATKDNGNKTTVPNVVGMQQADAIRRVRAQGLEPGVVFKASSAPRGQVVAETPGAGSQLKKGQAVVLDISRSAQTTTTPTVTAPTTTAKTTTVTKTVTNAVTTTATATQASTVTQPAKTVTQPTVTQPPTTAAMPDVTGQADYSAAVQQVANVGLLPQTYPVASNEPQGTVVGQNPPAGTQQPSNVPVRLNVSLGPGTRSAGPLPDLTGLKALDALVKCASTKYTCRIVFRTAPSAASKGKVLAQQPQAGVNAPGLTQITLYVGR
jgi:beta-lactam-binding protein with PASTA domain